MNIDEYLNNLQNDLDQRLSGFGVETSRQAEQPSGDNAMGTEFKFCPECGTKVDGYAKFCPNCGYRFNTEEPAEESSPVDSNNQEEDSAPTQQAPSDKTRIIEVRVWTGYLGTMYINPVCTDESRKAVHDANGEYDWELEERVQELSDCGYTQVHFVNSGEDVRLQVYDGDECIVEQDELPTIEAASLDRYVRAIHNDDEATEDNWDDWYNYEDDEREAAIDQFHQLAQSEAPDDGDYNSGMVQTFWKQLQNGEIAEENGFMIGLIRSISDQLVGVDMEYDSEQSFLNSIGNVGKGIVTFQIEIPESEPFDTNKLHFFSECEWWDTNIHEAFFGSFVGMEDTSLELLEYNGKIYCRQEAEYVPGWKDTGGTILVHADLTEFDPDDLNYEVDEAEGERHSDESQENSVESFSVNSDYNPEELRRLYDNVYDARRAYLEKAKERLNELFNIAVKRGHEQDFGWQDSEEPDSEENEEEYERFCESRFYVIRTDDFCYQTSEIIGIRFRLENSEIVITAYYDDENDEIVEDCELYFNYDYAENYNAVAFCIKTIEKELEL